MRIFLVTESYTEKMGYLQNVLPKYLARLGADVHVITTNLNSYHHIRDFSSIYDNFISSSTFSEVETSAKITDGFTLHKMPYRKVLGNVQIKGWLKQVELLRPEILQTANAVGWIPLQAAIAKSSQNYKLFVGSHRGASTFKLSRHQKIPLTPAGLSCFISRTIPGKIISQASEKCYCPTGDSAEIAWKFFGIEKNKVEVMFLGVDTDYFYPLAQPQQQVINYSEKRSSLGFDSKDIVCIYTGKMTEEKNAVLLAQAIQRLRAMGESFSGLFIGNGIQSSVISKTPFCKVIDLVPYNELGDFYRIADIGVWPTNESISMLDAAACGLPLIVSDGIGYLDHVTGNGLVYNMNNLDSLVSTLLHLKDTAYRKRLGIVGSQKMKLSFSWDLLARRRLADYETALQRK